MQLSICHMRLALQALDVQLPSNSCPVADKCIPCAVGGTHQKCETKHWSTLSSDSFASVVPFQLWLSVHCRLATLSDGTLGHASFSQAFMHGLSSSCQSSTALACKHSPITHAWLVLQATFVLAGGPVLPSLLPQAWLVGYYSTKLGHWNFHPVDPTVYKFSSDACAGTFEIQATSWRRSLVIKLQAAPDSFVSLQCPTPAGFRVTSVESFLGHAHIEAFVYQSWPWHERGWKLVEAVDIDNVALEFGGLNRCQHTTVPQDAKHAHAGL